MAMLTHTNKNAGQAIKGAGVPALPLIFPRVIADGKNQVRKSLAGRSPSMGELQGKCAAIDFLHFITAKHYQLELLSNDKDMKQLEDGYTAWLNNESSGT
jgi:hypothetical protein